MISGKSDKSEYDLSFRCEGPIRCIGNDKNRTHARCPLSHVFKALGAANVFFS